MGAEVQGAKLSRLPGGGEEGVKASGAPGHGEGQGEGAAPGKQQTLERIGPDHGTKPPVPRMQRRGPNDEGDARPEAPPREQFEHEGHGKDPHPLAQHGADHEESRGGPAIARAQL